MGRLFNQMTRGKKKLFAVSALVMMGGLLLLPIFLSVTAVAGGGGAPAGGPPADVVAAKEAGAEGEEKKVEMGRDVYYKTEGPAIGMPAPKTEDNETFYPRYNFESRVLLWVA